MKVYRMKKKGVLLLAFLTSVLVSSCGANNTQEEYVESKKSDFDKEMVVVPANRYYWAADTANDIYYIEEKKLWRYGKITGDVELVTENLHNPFDIIVYDKNIYTIETVDDEENPVRVFLYSNKTDEFNEVLTIPVNSRWLYVSDHYLIDDLHTLDDSGIGRIYDLTNPEEPIEVDWNKVELVKEMKPITTNSDVILYRGDVVAGISDFLSSGVDVVGWSDNYGFVKSTSGSESEFFRFKFEEPYAMEKMGENIKDIAIFDEVMLVKSESGKVEIRDLDDDRV